MHGLSQAVARNEEEAATLAAVLLRETLERPGETAALITPDTAMARRVSARLARWGVEADSSAGRPLANYPSGDLLALVARAATGVLDPATMLAVLKHPLVRLGMDEATLTVGRRNLERYGFRGTRPRDWAVIARRLTQARDRHPREGDNPTPDRMAGFDAALRLAASLEQAFALAAAPLMGGDANLSDAARALGHALESLARDDRRSLGGPLGRGGRRGGRWIHCVADRRGRSDGRARSLAYGGSHREPSWHSIQCAPGALTTRDCAFLERWRRGSCGPTG